MEDTIISAFHRSAGLSRSDVFFNDLLMPLTAKDDALVPAAGWVGAGWSNGTLMIGINPGGGGDNYRRNPDDDRLYELLRQFRDVKTLSEQTIAFERLSAGWIDIQRTHNIWRIINAILEATGESAHEIAFMNILPFRTRMDKQPSAKTLKEAWEKIAEPQILALRPRRIIALGKKAWNVLTRFKIPDEAELILFKRGIGDSYVPMESQAVLRQLAAERAAFA